VSVMLTSACRVTIVGQVKNACDLFSARQTTCKTHFNWASKLQSWKLMPERLLHTYFFHCLRPCTQREGIILWLRENDDACGEYIG